VIASDPRAARPGVALRPVAKTGDLKCRVLRVDTERANDPDEQLLRKFSPEFVNLPAITDGDAKPYPNGEHDYQPNAVEVFLDQIGTVRQAPRGLFGWANIVYTAASYILLGVPALMALIGAPLEWILGVLGAALLNTGLAVIALVPAYRWAQTPSGADRIRSATAAKDAGDRYAMTTFPANRVGNPTSAWANYHAALSNKAALRDIVVYGRVLAVEDEHVSKVLQYWLFYYYNDWWNSHEADWEVAMVYLGGEDQPIAAACSSHLSGTWRPWPAVEGVSDTLNHPRIYVARGSHAMYFNVSGGIHYAVLRQPWAVFDFSGQLLVKGSKDAVGRPTEEDGRYRLEIMPTNPEREVLPPDPNKPGDESDAWRRWWWLRFEGRWGREDGILSPAIQEAKLRWDRPVSWARDHCAADSTSWDEVMPAAAPGPRQ
jgi:hypothetical protein